MKGFKFLAPLEIYTTRPVFLTGLGLILFGLLILTPKTNAQTFEGEVKPNQGIYPQKVFFYDVNGGVDTLIDSANVNQSTGYYSRAPACNMGDTIKLKFKDNEVAPVLGEIYIPGIWGGSNFPPTIHCRQNAGEPLVNFTAYRQQLGVWGGGDPTFVAGFIKNNTGILLDTLIISPLNYQHVMHLKCQFQNPDSFRLLLWRDDANPDFYYPHFIPSQDSWIPVVTNFGEVVNLNTDGISNNPYDIIWPLSLIAQPKPLDGAVESIDAPTQVRANLPFTVNAFIKNVRWFNSLAPCSLKVITTTGDTIVRIGKADTLAPFESSTITLNLTIPSAGNHKILAKTYANNDQNPSNDTVSIPIEVLQGEPDWNQLTDVPEGSGKRCKAGTDACSDAYNRIWITKGGTLENYFWTPTLTGSGTWTTATILPAGQKGKTKKGASLIYASGKIYYKEGYGQGFWCKDSSANTSWTPLANYTINEKFVKAGTSLAWDNGDLIYMTVGSKNQDGRPVLAIYSISGNSWTNELLPEGLVPKKKFKEGASIVYTPDGLFAAVGQTSELLKRDMSGNWTKATNIPINKKFSGDIAYNPIDNYIYTNEGKNVANFNRYPIAGGAWQSLTAWSLGREGKNPKECAITCSDGIIYGVKGKNTRGFWEYVPTSSFEDNIIPNQPVCVQTRTGRPENDVQSYPVSITKIAKRIPSIMNLSQVKSYAGNFRIYRADGREVKSKDLKQGIYFFKSEAIGSNTYKVIIAR